MTDAPEPYRPSNGDEGESFMGRWCAHCIHEKPFRDSGGNEGGCSIILRSMTYDIGSPYYPKEWVEDASGPRCTAFQHEDGYIGAVELIQDMRQMEMFPAVA